MRDNSCVFWGLLSALAAALAAVVAAPAARADACRELCAAAATRQLNEEEKRTFALCAAQNKCPPANPADRGNVRQQNPLVGPFQRP